MTTTTDEDYVVRPVTFRLTEKELKVLDDVGSRKYRLNGKGDRNRTIRLLIEDAERELK